MEELSTLAIAGLLLVYALVSWRLHRVSVSMPAAMLAAGFILGADGLGVIHLDFTSEAVKLVAELTLALMLFHDACRIGLGKLRGQAALPLRLLGIGLPVMIVLGTIVGYLLFPSAGWVAVALVATMLAPTDAALGEEVVTDHRLPGWLRQGLNVESGLNDGLCVPVFLVLLTLAGSEGESTRVVAEFVRAIGLGVLAGAIFGGGGGALTRLARAHDWMLPEWSRYAMLAAALSCYVAAAVMGGSGFIGAFVGGLFFGTTAGKLDSGSLELTGNLGTAFDAVAFVLLGAVLVPDALAHLSWPVVVYAVLSLVAVRMVSVAIAMIGTGAAWPTIAFMGWFGPRGLATVVFTVLLLEAQIPGGERLAAVAVTGVVLSVFAHGFSAPALVGVYSKWYESAQTDSMPEQLEVDQPPVRGHGLVTRKVGLAEPPQTGVGRKGAEG